MNPLRVPIATQLRRTYAMPFMGAMYCLHSHCGSGKHTQMRSGYIFRETIGVHELQRKNDVNQHCLLSENLSRIYTRSINCITRFFCLKKGFADATNYSRNGFASRTVMRLKFHGNWRRNVNHFIYSSHSCNKSLLSLTGSLFLFCMWIAHRS